MPHRKVNRYDMARTISCTVSVMLRATNWLGTGATLNLSSSSPLNWYRRKHRKADCMAPLRRTRVREVRDKGGKQPQPADSAQQGRHGRGGLCGLLLCLGQDGLDPVGHLGALPLRGRVGVRPPAGGAWVDCTRPGARLLHALASPPLEHAHGKQQHEHHVGRAEDVLQRLAAQRVVVGRRVQPCCARE